MPNLTDVLEEEDRSTVEQIVLDMDLGAGDMYKSVYDTGGTDGIVDNAEKVNNLTVETAVPATFDFDNVAFTNVNNTYTVAQSGDREVITYAATVNPDFETSNRFQVTLTGNITIGLPSNISENQGGVIYVVQGGSIWHSTAWNAVFKPMNTVPVTGAVGDIEVYSYEVYSATKIILNYVGTI